MHHQTHEPSMLMLLPSPILTRTLVQVQKQEELLESSTDALEWKMEVERVMPSLKVHLRGDKVSVRECDVTRE